MDGSFGNLRLYSVGPPPNGNAVAEQPTLAQDTTVPSPSIPDAVELANRELIRPPTYQRGHRWLEPFSAAWFDELEQKRYTRHGGWLPSALEFGRHPGESILILGPGVGSDAVRYLQHDVDVTVAVSPADQPKLIRENITRHGFSARIAPIVDDRLPFPDGAFDVVAVNALHSAFLPDVPPASRAAQGMEPFVSPVDELYRVLKAGGKVIGLFPAYYDAGFWQDLFLPLQRLYWRRPPDSTSAPKTTRRELGRLFGRFADHRVYRRHLRRAELPHLWRVLPLVVLERLIGKILVFKAFKPISANRSTSLPSQAPDSLAA